MKKNKLQIIAITGAFGSGKSTVATLLSSKGFEKIILSSFLEEELKKRGTKKITRKILQDLGNEWRERYGTGVLAKKALEYALREKKSKIVIDGIRNIGEIEEFKKKESFLLISILADRKVRFERLKKIKRRESLTWKIFEQLDSRDLGIKEKSTGLQVAFCIALSDIFITNNRTKKELKNKLSKALKEIL